MLSSTYLTLTVICNRHSVTFISIYSALIYYLNLPNLTPNPNNEKLNLTLTQGLEEYPCRDERLCTSHCPGPVIQG